MGRKLQPGDAVTVTREVKPYYAGYGVTPDMTIRPGMVGSFVKGGIPSTCRNRTFAIADFVVNGVVWRVADCDGATFQPLD
jgi:hypothetical protein